MNRMRLCRRTQVSGRFGNASGTNAKAMLGVAGFEPTHGGVKVRCLFPKVSALWGPHRVNSAAALTRLRCGKAANPDSPRGNAGVAGFEPTHGGVKVRCLFPKVSALWGPHRVNSAAALTRLRCGKAANPDSPRGNAGVAGFEPTHGGVKVRCLFPKVSALWGPHRVNSAAALTRLRCGKAANPDSPRGNAGVAGFEPTHGGVKVRCLFPKVSALWGPHRVNSAAALTRLRCGKAANPDSPRGNAGVAGFEPTHGGVKVRCLTAWLHPTGHFCLFYACLGSLIEPQKASAAEIGGALAPWRRERAYREAMNRFAPTYRAAQ